MNDQQYCCPVCNEQNNHPEDKMLNVFVCHACRHVFSKSNVKTEDVYILEYYSEEHKNWFLHPNIRLFGIIESFIKSNVWTENLAVLDVGCGRGDLLHFLSEKQQAWSLYGIDVSENKGQDIVYMQGDFIDYKFNQKFDVVTGLMVIEHVADPVSFVKKIGAVLSDGGSVFLTTVNSNSLIYRIARVLRKLGWRTFYDRLYHHHHLQHFNNISLRCLLERNGFTVIKQYSHNFPFSAVDLPPAPAILKTIYRSAVAVLFGFTNFFGGGVNQTIICKKNT